MTTDLVIDPTAVGAETLRATDLRNLGVHGRQTYAAARDGSREFRVGRALAAFELANAPRRGEVRILRMTRDEAGRPRREYLAAYEVPPGTYAGLRAASEARAERKARRETARQVPHLEDIADHLSALDRVEETARLIGGGRRHAGRLGVVADVLSPRRGQGRLRKTPGRDPVRGVEAVAAWLREQGCALEVAGSRLVVRAKATGPEVRNVLSAYEPLLVGLLSGSPVPCALKHRGTPPPAWSYAVPRLPVCREHLEDPGGD